MNDTITFKDQEEFWCPYGNHWKNTVNTESSTSNPTNTRWMVRPSWPRNSTVVKEGKDDFRAKRFAALQEAIARLSLMNPSSDFFVEPGATRKAADFLALVSENYEITPPKILPEENDTLVLTWDVGDFRRYLSVADDSYGLLDIHNTKDVRCKHIIPDDEQAAIMALIAELRLSSKSSSVR